MIKVVADNREVPSGIPTELENLGTDVEMKQLEVGDYVLSDRVAVERKTGTDFVSSLIDDRKLFRQISDLARSYDRPILILEGKGLYKRNVHPDAIKGALSAIAVGFGVSILPTHNQNDTASMIYTIAKREQEDHKREISLHGKRSHLTIGEQREYCVTSISDIGPVTAKNLLEHFKSIQAVIDAPIDELMKVKGVGKLTAERIRDVVGGEYLSSEERGKT